MIRDYIAYKLQEIQEQINALHEQEQTIKEKKSQDDQQAKGEAKEAEKEAEKVRKALLGTQSPSTTSQSQTASAIYHFLAATQMADETSFRTEWQKSNRELPCLEWMQTNKFEENFKTPKIDLDVLPSFSFVLQFTFTLAQSYISHDEQDFYIIDNPVRKDKILGLPYVASTSWKGSLRATLWRKAKGYTEENEYIYRLFGNKKGEEVQEKLHAGRLYFFPTFFGHKALEMINPQNRAARAGEKPIVFESVPARITQGIFTLLYVPFDRVGQDEKETRKQVAEELKIVAEGLQAMFRIYGFGAKTSDGFGLAKEEIVKGMLRLRAEGLESKEETVIRQPAVPQLARYLEAPGRLRPEYLTSEGTFRERSEAELKKMSRSDRQLYDKAKAWWEREGRRLAESVPLPEPVGSVVRAPLPQDLPVSWPEWSFNSFGQLMDHAEEVANKLTDGGGE